MTKKAKLKKPKSYTGKAVHFDGSSFLQNEAPSGVWPAGILVDTNPARIEDFVFLPGVFIPFDQLREICQGSPSKVRKRLETFVANLGRGGKFKRKGKLRDTLD